jgi:hypothetical protein
LWRQNRTRHEASPRCRSMAACSAADSAPEGLILQEVVTSRSATRKYESVRGRGVGCRKPSVDAPPDSIRRRVRRKGMSDATISCGKSELGLGLAHDEFRPSVWERPRAPAPARVTPRERARKYFLALFARNPLKSLDSDERIQGNPRKSNPQKWGRLRRNRDGPRKPKTDRPRTQPPQRQARPSGPTDPRNARSNAAPARGHVPRSRRADEGRSSRPRPWG